MASIDTIVEVPSKRGTTWRRLPAGTKAPKGARYRARWRTPDGASRTATFDRKLDAQRHLVNVEGAKQASTYVDPSAGRVTFKDYAETWLEGRTVRPATLQTARSHVQRHLIPAFGDRRLHTITREDVKAFAASLQPALKPTTARAIMVTLSAIFSEATDNGRLTKNPAERIKLGTKSERRVDPTHIATIAQKVPEISAAMPERWRAAVLLMSSTGLRLGECLGLTVDHVNFLKRTIHIDRQITAVGGTAFGPTKTTAGVRTIPVSQSVIDMLAAHLASFPAGRDGLLFTTPPRSAGGVPTPVDRSKWSAAYRAACATAGLLGSRTHDLRHVAASSFIASGLTVKVVSAVLGHATASETLDVYTHLWPGDDDRTRAAIEQAAAWWSKPANVG